MAFNLVNLTQLDLSEINYSNPQKIKGSYISHVSCNDTDIYIKTPPLRNLTEIEKIDTKSVMELEFDKHSEFYEQLSNFDDHNMLKIHKTSKQWFNKEFPLDVVEDFYSSSLKHKNNPKLKLKFNSSKQSEGASILVYDKNNNITNSLQKYCQVICILKFNGLKFLSQQVISEWVPIQIKTDYVATDTNSFLIDDNFNETKLENYEKSQEESQENQEESQENQEESQENQENQEESQENHEVIEVQENHDEVQSQEESQEESQENQELEKLKDIEKKKISEYESENNLQDFSSNLLSINEYENIITQTKLELEKYKDISLSKERELQEIKEKIKNF